MGRSCKTKGVFKESDFVSGDGMLMVSGVQVYGTLFIQLVLIIQLILNRKIKKITIILL